MADEIAPFLSTRTLLSLLRKCWMQPGTLMQQWAVKKGASRKVILFQITMLSLWGKLIIINTVAINLFL